MPGTKIELTKDGSVARIMLRGDKGIQMLSAATRRQLLEIVETVGQSTASVVLFAADGRTFIAGASIEELRQHDEHAALEDSRAGQRLMNAIESLPQTTVCAIHSACAGGGTELALACDIRLAATEAKIGLPETSIGVLPGWGGTVRATRLLGAAVARRLILTGELIAADEALRIGLVDAVFPADQFREAVEVRLAQLLTRAPQARRRAKHLLQELAFSSQNSTEQFEAEARAFAECYRTVEPQEGQSAFLEKRPAKWLE